MHYVVCQRTSINHSHWRGLLGLKSLSWFVMDYNLNQNVGVDGQEQQPGQPDPHEGVAAFELQEVGRAEPGPLRGGRHIGRWLLWNLFLNTVETRHFFFTDTGYLERDPSSYLSSKPEQQQPSPPFEWQTQVGDDQRQETQIPQEVLGHKGHAWHRAEVSNSKYTPGPKFKTWDKFAVRRWYLLKRNSSLKSQLWINYSIDNKILQWTTCNCSSPCLGVARKSAPRKRQLWSC